MVYLDQWGPLTWTVGTITFALLAGYLLHILVWRLARALARRSATEIDDLLIRRFRRPTVLILPSLALYMTLPLVGKWLGDGVRATTGDVLVLVLIVSGAWAVIRLTSVVEEVVTHRFDIDASDNLRARAIHTQVGILRKIVIVIVLVLAMAMMLMSYEPFRQIGTGILASAGLAGLVIGLAAQRTLANLLAGIQLAITQPIRLDDVVIVEGEWGRIEEITLTYVVVRIWDLRRLVLPISYFLEKPFQNWTRNSAEILGIVFLYMDYRVPVEAIRAELQRIAEGSDLWDGKVCGVQVTGATADAVEVRALVSAADASAAWDLRCEVRERLIDFLQRNYPDALPRVRAEVRDFASGQGSGDLGLVPGR